MKPLITAFQQTLRSVQLLYLLYAITLIMGLLVALPFYSTLIVEDQNSLAFLNLLNGFDYTIFSDFMHRNGRTLAPLLRVGRWLGLLYVVLSIYFSGGILTRFAQFFTVHSTNSFTVGHFWQASSAYVGRFLRLFGVTFLFLLISAGVWLILGSLVGVALSDALTERGEFWISVVFFGLLALTATLIFCVGDYAKVLMVRGDELNAFRAFGLAGRLVLGNISRTYGLYCLLIVIGTGVFGIYFLIDEAILMSNWLTILLMFIVQQALIFARVVLKVWSLGTAFNVYEALPKPQSVFRLQSIPDGAQDLIPDEEKPPYLSE